MKGLFCFYFILITADFIYFNRCFFSNWNFFYMCPSIIRLMHAFSYRTFDANADLHIVFVVWKKVEETKSLQSFWVLQRKTDFPLFYEAFEKVDTFWGQNGTTHEINSIERANSPLSDDAKQNSVRWMIFELWFF